MRLSNPAPGRRITSPYGPRIHLITGQVGRLHRGIDYGGTYDEDRDAFIPPKPFDSWVLDEATCLWVAPIEYPADGGTYTWDESLGDWVEVVSETT